MHWQDAALLLSWQTALDPHGEGLHGSMTSVGMGTEIDALSYLHIYIHMTHTCCYPRAVAEGVAGVARITGAGGSMVGGATCCVRAADPRTRVYTLVSNACLVCWTVVVDRALWLALDIRISEHLRETSTGCSAVPLIAYCVDAAWRGIARVYNLWPWGLGRNSVASAEGVSLISLVAHADRNMVPDSAVSIDAAKTRTRVLTFSVDASQLLRAVRVDNALRATIGRRADHLWHTSAVTSVSNLLRWK